MSKATDAPAELPDRIDIAVYKDADKRRFQEAHARLADRRGVEEGEIPRTEVLTHLLDTCQFTRLEDDKRIQQAREVVANDHDVAPEDVSLADLLKITAGAYTGFQQTSDWEIEQ